MARQRFGRGQTLPKRERVSRVMRGNKGKDTRPEIALRHALRDSGIKGYRIHWKGAPGRPDIAFPGRKVAIFVHGCFWHRCPYCKLPIPKSNRAFWLAKFKRNKERDGRYIQSLDTLGWGHLIVWECEVNKDAERVVRRIKKILDSSDVK